MLVYCSSSLADTVVAIILEPRRIAHTLTSLICLRKPRSHTSWSHADVFKLMSDLLIIDSVSILAKVSD